MSKQQQKPVRAVAADSSVRDVTAERELRYRAIFNSTFQFMGVLDTSGNILDANEAALQFAGVTREQVVGMPVWESPWFEDNRLRQQRVRDAVARAASGGFVRYDETISGHNSTYADIDFSLKPVLDDAGAVCMLIPEGRDMTDSQLVRSALRDSERRFRLSFDYAPIGKAMVEIEGGWMRANNALCEILGYDEIELSRMTWQQLTHADDVTSDKALVADTLAGNRGGYRMFKRYIHKSGRIVPAQLDVTLVRDDAGSPVYFIAQIQDISARQLAEDALFEAKELAQVTLASIGDGVLRTDARGRITYVNDAACSLLGVARSQLVGERFGKAVKLLEQGRDIEIPDMVDTLLRLGSGVPAPAFPRLQVADGSLRSISPTLSPMYGRDGALLGCVFVFQDVSEANRQTEEWAFQANHDPLTGLLNRRAFEAALRDACAGVENSSSPSALLYFDLDHFKIVNDTCGHPAGDKLLVDMARLLRRRLRTNDRLARLGGDEFGVLLPNCTLEDAEAVAQGLLRGASEYSFVTEGRRFTVTLSIGVAPVTSSYSETLARADTACYVAKQGGRNRAHAFRPSDAEVNRARRELDWAQQLGNALEGEGFVLHRQPVVRLSDNAVVGQEILLRFQAADGRLVAPGAFMPAARRLGLMSQIDLRVLKDTLKAVAAGKLPEGFVAINLSAQSLNDPLFTNQCLAMLDATRLPAERLRFEITESEQSVEAPLMSPLVAGLRERGFALWLDDFGTGFNSFETLKRLKPDGIKIHRTYIEQLSTEAVYRHFVDAACSAMAETGGGVIAEGLESPSIREILSRRGVTLAQGFLLGGVTPLTE